MPANVGLILFFAMAADPLAAVDDDFFESRIRPVLVESCFRCHGGKETHHGLRLDSRASLVKGGESGPAMVPAEPDKSLLLRAIGYTDDDLQMPPDRRLPDSVVRDFRRWIAGGAPWPSDRTIAKATEGEQQRHWAFQPVRPVAVPQDAHWSSHPIDRFIAANWKQRGLRPVGLADKRTLLRRLHFDLIGLPPTPAQMRDFLADDRPDAVERWIDRLLASPLYGERWGRHWLDVVRYADTAGDNADYPVPEAALYRDYVIDAFQCDKPFDDFVREQLAGDLLASGETGQAYAEQVIATTFLGLSRRYATAPYEFWHLTLEDTIDVVGQAFLGLTVRCARCHDHKFDPVSTRDYYALYGIFESTQYPWAGGEEFASKQLNRQHFVPLLPPAEAAPHLTAHAKRVSQSEAEIARMERNDPLAIQIADLDKRIQTAKGAVGQGSESATSEADVAQWIKQRDELQSQLSAKLQPMRGAHRNLLRSGLPIDLPAAYGVSDGKPHDAAIQRKGDPQNPGDVVPRAAPAFWNGRLDIPSDQSGRLQLANWIVHPSNPLTARVLVNRLWQHHFGTGIVATASNFGTRGAGPTHPELLDWLAGRFVERDWSIKAMHRLILTAKVWRLSSDDDPSNAAIDTGNQYYWRHNRRRLDAEAIRDAMMHVSGQLRLGRPGGHPFPHINEWGWTQHNQFKAVYPTDHRTAYLMTQRLQRHPFLALFDGPDTNATVGKRSDSTVPLQALYLMNSPEIQAQADGFASRLYQCSEDARQRVRFAYGLAYGRSPTAEEEERGVRYLEQYSTALAAGGVVANERERKALTSYARTLLTSNEFFYVD